MANRGCTLSGEWSDFSGGNCISTSVYSLKALVSKNEFLGSSNTSFLYSMIVQRREMKKLFIIWDP